MRWRQSARLTPAPAIRINTSPSFGSGTGRVAGTSISGPPGALISMTVWVVGMLASTAVLSMLGMLRQSYQIRRPPPLTLPPRRRACVCLHQRSPAPAHAAARQMKVAHGGVKLARDAIYRRVVAAGL